MQRNASTALYVRKPKSVFSAWTKAEASTKEFDKDAGCDIIGLITNDNIKRTFVLYYTYK